MKRFFLVTVILELIFVGFLVVAIFKNKSDILGEAKIVPIDKNSIQFPQESTVNAFYELKPNGDFSTTIYGYKGEYNLNNDGLNERYDYSIEKKEDTFRIVTLGDSFTFGLYVDTKDNWPELIEDSLKKSSCNKYKNFEIINLGVGGYDIEFASERYRLRGKKYDPDLVIWFIKGDDLWQINSEMLPKVKKYDQEFKETGEYDELVKNGNPYPGWSKVYTELEEEYNIEDILDIQTKQLAKLESLFNKKLLYVKLPHVSKKEYDTALNKLLTGRLIRDKTYVYELPNLYKDPVNFVPKDGHPSKEGHTLIANSIFKYLLNNNIIDCN